jgi:tetratricopeptide (TPR) repeat protein
MTIKHFILVFCSITLVGCTGFSWSKKSVEYYPVESSEMEIKLKDAEAYLDRAATKNTDLNDTQGALADFNQAISLDPKLSLAYMGRADMKGFKLNDTKGALADYNQAISLDPKFSLAYLGRASLKMHKLSDRPGAIQDLRQAARLYREQGNTEFLQEALDGLQKLGATE